MNENELKKCLNNKDYLTKKYFSNQKYCMAYDKETCNGNIVKAHTISKKYVQAISENGHVYVPRASGNHKNNSYKFKLKGINKVTRITAFCKYHDNILFDSFEKINFNGSYNQIYDITFRALCREYYQKICLLQFFNELSKGNLDDLDLTGYAKPEYFKHHFNHLEKEIKDYNFLYTQLRKIKKYGLSYLLIRLSKLPILTTGVFFPLFDPDGLKIQNENKKQLGFIYNVISIDNQAYIIIATVASLHNNVHRDFLKTVSSMKEIKLINYLFTYFFFNNDNIVIEKNWFDGLPENFKSGLEKLTNLQVGHYGETCASLKLLDFYQVMNISDHADIKLNIS